MTAGWPTARGGPRNLGRCALPGDLVAPPVERYRFATGADIQYARTIQGLGQPAVLVQAGATLQLFGWDGSPRWADATLGVRTVLAAGELSPGQPPVAIVGVDERTAAVIDLRDGSVVWTWRSPPSSSLATPGSYKFFTSAQGAPRWVCFPTYATMGICFDLSNPLEPATVWEVEYGDTYDAGFGPHVIVADLESTGAPQIVLSSRTGSAYKVDDEQQRTTSAQIVLGREDGHLYQAIVDAEDGRIHQQVSYRPDPGDYPCARPYGLLQAVDVEGPRKNLVLVSCQVEEYFSVTRHDATGLSRRWGRFVEKDWPVDRFELRPQVTSVAQLKPTGGPELVVGLWDDERWRTQIIDIATGLDAGLRAELSDRYFWASADIDGDGRLEVVVSVESRRTPGRSSRLEIRDGETLEVKAHLEDAEIVTSPDSDLPEHIGFLANRRSAIIFEGEVAGLLVRTSDGIGCWGASDGQAMGVRPVADGGYTRADQGDGELILSDGRGRIARFDQCLREVARFDGIAGRSCQPLLWSRTSSSEIVVDRGDAVVVGLRNAADDGELRPAWQVDGELAALHQDTDGTARLSVADSADPADPAVVIHREPGAAGTATLVRVPFRAPARVALTPFGEEFRLLVNLGTGVHTAALAVLDAEGTICWEDDELGAHPQRPGIAPLEHATRVLADDHGRLRFHDAASGELLVEVDWTAAYTVPVSLPDAAQSGTERIIRADGLHGVESLDLEGRRQWRLDAGLWAYFGGASAVGYLGVGRRPTLGCVTRDGRMDAIDLERGQLVWSHELGDVAPDRTVAAADVDGDGCDEFLAGTRDGRLVCIGQDAQGNPEVRWISQLTASVTAIVPGDVDGDGRLQIVVSTADGHVRVLGAA